MDFDATCGFPGEGPAVGGDDDQRLLGPRLFPELAAPAVAALRAVSKEHAVVLQPTWQRLCRSCQVGALFEAGYFDALFGPTAATALRAEGLRRFPDAERPTS